MGKCASGTFRPKFSIATEHLFFNLAPTHTISDGMLIPSYEDYLYQEKFFPAQQGEGLYPINTLTLNSVYNSRFGEINAACSLYFN
jgi:hypothetical protein